MGAQPVLTRGGPPPPPPATDQMFSARVGCEDLAGSSAAGQQAVEIMQTAMVDSQVGLNAPPPIAADWGAAMSATSAGSSQIQITVIKGHTPDLPGTTGMWQNPKHGHNVVDAQFKPSGFNPASMEPAWCTEAGRAHLLRWEQIPTGTYQCAWCAGIGMWNGVWPDGTKMWGQFQPRGQGPQALLLLLHQVVARRWILAHDFRAPHSVPQGEGV